MTGVSDPWRCRAVPSAAGASAADIDLWSLQLPETFDLEEDAPMPLEHFAYLEAIHRLTMGVPGAWADQASVARAFAVLSPEKRRGVRRALTNASWIECLTCRPSRTNGVGVPMSYLVRHAREGALEHFAQRPVLLPLLSAARSGMAA